MSLETIKKSMEAIVVFCEFGIVLVIIICAFQSPKIIPKVRWYSFVILGPLLCAVWYMMMMRLIRTVEWQESLNMFQFVFIYVPMFLILCIWTHTTLSLFLNGSVHIVRIRQYHLVKTIYFVIVMLFSVSIFVIELCIPLISESKQQQQQRAAQRAQKAQKEQERLLSKYSLVIGYRISDALDPLKNVVFDDTSYNDLEGPQNIKDIIESDIQDKFNGLIHGPHEPENIYFAIKENVSYPYQTDFDHSNVKQINDIANWTMVSPQVKPYTFNNKITVLINMIPS